MNYELQQRLNQIPDIILAEDFREGRSLGGDLNFWIFEYEPEDELAVREYVEFLNDMIAKKHSHLKATNINLLQALVSYLEERNYTEKATQIQKQKGDEALLKALKGPLHNNKFVPYLLNTYDAANQDLIFLSGMGSVWPMLRAHSLLNGLHAPLGNKPVILFYPGRYNGQVMSLFGKITSKEYYRAFQLVPPSMVLNG